MTRDDDRQSRGLLSRLLRRKRDEPEVPTSGLFTARTVPVPPPGEPPEERLFDGVADAWTEPREAEAVEPDAAPGTHDATTGEPDAEPVHAEPVAEAEDAATVSDLADELHRYVTEAPTDDVWDEDDLPGARLPEESPDVGVPEDNLFRAPTRTVDAGPPPEDVVGVLDVLDRDWPDEEPSWVDTATEPDWDDDAPTAPTDHAPEVAPASLEPTATQTDADDTDLQAAAATALWEHEEDEEAAATAEPEVAQEPAPDVATEPEPEPEPAAGPEPEPEVATEREAEPEPEVARVPIGEEPPLHGPKQIRVYDDRLDRRPGPIQMSPSEAVALAKDGRSALQRRTRRED